MRFQLVKMTKDIAWVLDGETGKVYRTLIDDLANATMPVLPATPVRERVVDRAPTFQEEKPAEPVRPAVVTPRILENGAVVPEILAEHPEAYGRATSPRPRSIVPRGMGLEGVSIPHDQPNAAVETRRV